MTPSVARTQDDRPVELTTLNQALQPFRLSYLHTQLVLSVFDKVLRNVYTYYQHHPIVLPPEDFQHHIHGPWQRMLEAFRDRHEDEYSDPESLQVAQAMAKQDPVRIWWELDAHVRHDIFSGPPSQARFGRGRWYNPANRGEEWLVECAILGLPEMSSKPDEKDIAVALLTAIASRGPRYGFVETNSIPDARRELFGPGGVLWNAMRSLPEDSRKGIASILEVVVQQALNVALVFKYSWEQGFRASDLLPPYKWYVSSLEQARKKYVLLVECRDPRTRLPYQVQESLLHINFVELWDGLWQKAVEFSTAVGFASSRLDFDMYVWVTYQMKLPSSDPKPEVCGNRDMAAIAEQRCQEHWTDDLEAVPKVQPDGFHLPGLSNSLDVGAMRGFRGPRYPYRGWGSRFYDNDEVSDVSDDEEDGESDLDVNEMASVEAYGPSIDPTDVAHVAMIKPEDQRCTICMEDHFYVYGDSRTMKLNTCGHLFHYECIFDWVNGVSSNSNLCPECRVQFSQERRRVRPTQPAPVSQLSSPPPSLSLLSARILASSAQEQRDPQHASMSRPALLARTADHIEHMQAMQAIQAAQMQAIQATQETESTSTSAHQDPADHLDTAEDSDAESIYRQFTSGTLNGHDLVMEDGSEDEDDAYEEPDTGGEIPSSSSSSSDVGSDDMLQETRRTTRRSNRRRVPDSSDSSSEVSSSHQTPYLGPAYRVYSPGDQEEGDVVGSEDFDTASITSRTLHGEIEYRPYVPHDRQEEDEDDSSVGIYDVEEVLQSYGQEDEISDGDMDVDGDDEDF
jgi:hypothetical protein